MPSYPKPAIDNTTEAPTRGPSPDKIARFGHIAVAIREGQAASKLTAAEIMRRIGLKSDSTAFYYWRGAHGAPGPQYAEKLSEVFGLPVENFRPRDISNEPDRPGQPETAPPAVHPAPPQAAAAGIQKLQDQRHSLSFNLTSPTEARVTLDITLPISAALSLLNLITHATGLEKEEPKQEKERQDV